jgi:hypothetical protein
MAVNEWGGMQILPRFGAQVWRMIRWSRTLAEEQRVLARASINAVTLGIFSGLVVGSRLFLPSPVGYANNGDYYRAMCVVDLKTSYMGPAWFSVHFSSARRDCGSYPEGYASSLNALLRVARGLTAVIGGQGMDLRWLGVWYAVAAGVLAGVVAARLPRRALPRIGMVTLTTVITADSLFADWAMSVLGESAETLGALLVVAGALVLGVRRATDAAGLILVTLGGLLVCCSKAQSVTWIVTCVIVLAAWCWLAGGRRDLATRIGISLVSLAVLLTGTVWVATHRDRHYAQDNATTLIFDAILPNSGDPVAALRELGIPPQYSRFSGHTPFEKDHPNGADWAEVRKKVTLSNAMHYFARHPRVDLRVASRAAQALYAVRANRQGNYTQESGAPPRAQDHRLIVVTAVIRRLAPLALPGLAAIFLLLLTAAALAVRRACTRFERSWATTSLGLAVGLPLQFLMSAFGDGLEPIKHQAGTLVIGCLTVMTLAGFTTVRFDNRQQQQPAIDELDVADAAGAADTDDAVPELDSLRH